MLGAMVFQVVASHTCARQARQVFGFRTFRSSGEPSAFRLCRCRQPGVSEGTALTWPERLPKHCGTAKELCVFSCSVRAWFACICTATQTVASNCEGLRMKLHWHRFVALKACTLHWLTVMAANSAQEPVAACTPTRTMFQPHQAERKPEQTE